MRALIGKITLALAVACGCASVVSCGNEGGGKTDGGGSGGSGGMGGSDAPGTVGCLTPDMVPLTCPTPPVSFANIQPIMQARCVSICHNGVTRDPNGDVIWGLVDKEHVLQWEDTVRSTMADCVMPPADAGVPMTIEERKAIIEFIRCEGRK